MYITNQTELKEYIFRQLGSEQHRIEISDTNFEDIYQKSIKKLYDHTTDSVNEKFILFNPMNSKEVTLSSNIQTVLDLHMSNNSFSDSTIAYPGSSPMYDFLIGNDIQTSAYTLFVENMRDIRQTFRNRIFFRYNTESKKLILTEEINQNILLRVLEQEDIATLYQNEFLLKLLERDCWKQWRVNTSGKYLGSTIGNGITINSEFMDEQYNRLNEEVKESIENEEFDFLRPTKI